MGLALNLGCRFDAVALQAFMDDYAISWSAVNHGLVNEEYASPLPNPLLVDARNPIQVDIVRIRLIHVIQALVKMERVRW